MKVLEESADSIAFLERLKEALERLPLPEGARLAVALSGGVDSIVLLAALGRLLPGARLRALHVDHGLHADSAAWAKQCSRTAAEFGVAFVGARIDPPGGPGLNLEAAARDKRYAELAGMISAGEVLVTAHHGDDQLETVLLRLLRGAGVRGLTAIHEFAPFGPGFLARPLLWATREEITAQARRWNLTWVEDPANREQRYDRSFLRARIVPVLRERWPAAPRLAAGLARRMSEAEQLLDGAARQDAAEFTNPGRVPCSALRALGAARLNNLLRYLIRHLDLPMASAAHLDRLRAAIGASGDTSFVLVGWPGVEARLHRDHLYLMRTLVAAAPSPAALLTATGELRGQHGCLRLVPSDDAGFPDAWVREGLEVRFRTGGERFTPPRRAHTKSLKQWFQETGIVPWMRDRIPLLYRDGALIGIADFSISEEARIAASSGPRWCASWTDHPPVY